MEHLYREEDVTKTKFEAQIAALKVKFASGTNTHKMVMHCIEVRAKDGIWIPCGFTGEGATKAAIELWDDAYKLRFDYPDTTILRKRRGRNWSTFYQYAHKAADTMKTAQNWGDGDLSYRIVRYPMPAIWADEIAANAVWLEREKTRMLDGTYQDVPWYNETWWIDGQSKNNHVAHVSVKTPHKIAYTPNYEYGAADRQISVSIGKYLRDFYSHTLRDMEGKNSGRKRADGSDLYLDAFTYYQEQFVTQFGDSNTLHYATTADDMEQVYINGPASCMGGQDINWESDIHPARVYAAGDLHLAYTKDTEDKITSRALVWPDKKLVGRIYGDEGSLQHLLTLDDYKMANAHALEGARLAIIPYDRGHVMPFIDGASCYTVVNNPKTGKNEFYLGYDRAVGGIRKVGGYQNGLDYDPEEEDTFTCGCCDEQIDADYLVTVITARNHNGRTSIEDWCNHCADIFATICTNDNEYYSDSKFTLVDVHGYGLIVEHNLENIDYYVSAITRECFVGGNFAGKLNNDDELHVSHDDVGVYKLTFDSKTDSYYDTIGYSALINTRLDALLEEPLDQEQLHDCKQIELDFVLLAKAA